MNMGLLCPVFAMPNNGYTESHLMGALLVEAHGGNLLRMCKI